ncbi:hypothetical protein SARC_15830, partial [Sphaeroforma arctica JP610]
MSSIQRDLDNWLHAKLDDPWGGESISNILSAEQLSEIAARFTSFETQIKVKILL